MKTRSFGSYFLLIACFCFSIQSCCKDFCSDDNIFAIDFQGFTPTDLEKIEIVRIVQDDPAKRLDSFLVSTNNVIVKDTTRIYLDTPLTSGFDFQIKIEKASRTYSLSDFVVEKKNCRCSGGTYKKIVSYKLNGIQRSTPNYYPLEIRK